MTTVDLINQQIFVERCTRCKFSFLHQGTMLKVNRNKKLDDFLLVIKEGVNFTIALERVPKRIEGSDKAVQLLPSAGIQ